MSRSTPLALLCGVLLVFASSSLRAAEPPAEYLWRTGVNLVPDGDFNHTDGWRLIDPRKDEAIHPAIGDSLPVNGNVIVYRQPLGQGRSRNVLAMNLARRQMRGNSGVCVSEDIRVVPDMRYRLEYRCRSGGPRPMVLIRGMATTRDAKGNFSPVEMRQWRFVSVSPQPEQWTTVREEFTTEDAAMPIRVLRIELGGQRDAGYLFFDHIVLKAIGRPEAADTTKPATLPTAIPSTTPATMPAATQNTN